MVIQNFPIAFQQIYEYSKFFYESKEFPLSIIISKTPYLSASIAVVAAKYDHEEIFKSGKCILIPKLDGTYKWQHVVIEREEFINGQLFYYYKFRKPQNRKLNNLQEIHDVGLLAKPAKFFDEYAIVNHYADESEWLGKHDIVLSSDNELRTCSYELPYIVGNKLKFISWFTKDLEIPSKEGESIADIFAMNVDETPYSDIQFLSSYNPNTSEKPTIWIDKVPPTRFSGKALIFLSPYLSNFEEKMIQVGDLYQEQKLLAYKVDALPVKLGCLLAEQKCYKISLFSKECL